MTIHVVEKPAFQVCGLYLETRPQSPDIPALWPKFVPRIAEIRDRTGPDATYGVMWHGETSNVLHYMAAVAVSGADSVPAGMRSLAIPAGSYASFRYPFSGLGQGFGEIFGRLLPSSNYAQAPGPFFERYDEAFCPDDPGSVVEICIPVRLRG